MTGYDRPRTRGAHRQSAAQPRGAAQARPAGGRQHRHRGSHRSSLAVAAAPAAIMVAAAVTLPTAGLTSGAAPAGTMSGVAGVVTVPPTAEVAPAASQATTTAAIISAVQHSPLTAHVPASDYTVSDVRVSSTDPTYASAWLVPTDNRVGPAVAALHHDSAGWTVLDVGSGQVGCDVVPSRAWAELNLCPS